MGLLHSVQCNARTHLPRYAGLGDGDCQAAVAAIVRDVDYARSNGLAAGLLHGSLGIEIDGRGHTDLQAVKRFDVLARAEQGPASAANGSSPSGCVQSRPISEPSLKAKPCPLLNIVQQPEHTYQRGWQHGHALPFRCRGKRCR